MTIMFTWFWWFWKTSSPASLFFHKIDDDCSHMLFLNLCFKISFPNGVLLFRWHLPQAIINCSFPIFVFWYYHLLFLLFHDQWLWCSTTNFYLTDIYSSFIVHFQFLLFGIIIYFFLLFLHQSLWCSITNFI